MTIVPATPPTPYLRRLPNAFRTGPSTANVGPGVNILDFPSLSAQYESAHTLGATLVDYVSPTPAEQNLPLWSLLGVSFKASLYWISSGTFFGRLGGIFGGLLLPQDSFSSTGTGIYPYSVGVMSLPDPTFRTNLWTPDTDDAPPTYLFSAGVPTTNTPQSGYLQISGSLLLPQPVKITTGENIAIGLWMLPSLIGSSGPSNFSFGMVIAYASYVLTYIA